MCLIQVKIVDKNILLLVDLIVDDAMALEKGATLDVLT